MQLDEPNTIQKDEVIAMINELYHHGVKDDKQSINEDLNKERS